MKQLERIVNTIDSILASTDLAQYVIGITKSPKSRRSAYLAEGFQHFVILEVELTEKESLDLEEKLFSLFTSKSDVNSRYNKYHAEKRDDKYHRSSGGIHSSEKDYVLYVSWWSNEK